MKQNTTKLYNMIFPIWLLWFIPITWLVVLPANFAIDLLVVMLTMGYLKIENRKTMAKSVIFKVWIFGFIADFIGTVAMFMANIIHFSYETPMGQWWYENITNAVSYNPLDNIFSMLWVTVCVAITAVCIYFFNYKFCLKNLELPDEQKRTLARALAVFTAPYLFYLPTAWFF